MGLPGAAAVLIFLAPLDAMRKIRADGTVHRLPLLPYSSMCVNCMIWTTYGVLTSNPTLWVPNALGFPASVGHWGKYRGTEQKPTTSRLFVVLYYMAPRSKTSVKCVDTHMRRSQRF